MLLEDVPANGSKMEFLKVAPYTKLKLEAWQRAV